MGATKDENKDLTNFSLRLSASARNMFFPRHGKQTVRERSGAGLVSFATFLDGLLKNQISPIF